MIQDDEFVESQIAHCLGSVAGPGLRQDGPALDHAKAVSAVGALLWDTAQGKPAPWNGWREVHEGTADGPPRLVGPRKVNPEKHLGALRTLQASGLDFNAIIDMRDCRTRGLRLADGTVFPVFSFHRQRGRSDRVIWPLPGYQDLDHENFVGHVHPDHVPWSQKTPRVIWRGIPGGRAQPKGPEGHEGYRFGPLLRKAASGEWPPEQARAVLSSFPRHRFVEHLYSDPRADVGFVDRGKLRLSDVPVLRDWEKPRLTRQQMQGARYLAVVRGNDLASNFFWTMNSGSLALVMDGPFESFAACHFQPWVHYLPFKADMSDFDQIFDWAEAHQDECRQMARRAADVCLLLARADLRQRALAGVVARLGAAIRRGG